jgi:hypothetical protein
LPATRKSACGLDDQVKWQIQNFLLIGRALLVTAALACCATCRLHPVACTVAGAVVIGAAVAVLRWAESRAARTGLAGPISTQREKSRTRARRQMLDLGA